ncbi:hypothetical protein [Roseobacter sp.]|uniref:hypothetical protein n=1 Tax=Roseobacter sp. TaxID=1907202 RepID=UPI003298C47B
MLYFTGETARTWSDDGSRIAQLLQSKLIGVTDAIEAVQDASRQVEETTAAPDAVPQTIAIRQLGLLNAAVTVAASTATSIGVALVLALFLLASGDLFYVKVVQAFPTMREKKHALTTIYDIEHGVSGYLLVITLINTGWSRWPCGCLALNTRISGALRHFCSTTFPSWRGACGHGSCWCSK